MHFNKKFISSPLAIADAPEIKMQCTRACLQDDLHINIDSSTLHVCVIWRGMCIINIVCLIILILRRIRLSKVYIFCLFCIVIWFGYHVVTINVYKKTKDIQDSVDIKNTRHMIKISRH